MNALQAPVLHPAAALAWSEARVDDAASVGPYIAIWRPQGVTVAIGIGQTPAVELEIDAMRRDGVALIRRQSGGGAVLLYDGVVCWEAWADLDEIDRRYPDGSGIRQTYRALCLPVVEGLAELGVQAFHAGICDISHAYEGEAERPPRKLAGTAQLRRKTRALVHGSLLVCPDLDRLADYLKFPSDQPDYRKDRSHREFCTSVAEALGLDVGADGLMDKVTQAISRQALQAGWSVVQPVGEGDDPRRDALERDKYRSDGWNWERKRVVAQQ